jgi:hypothetical protein
MGLLDDAIREHLDLKRRRGADPAEIEKAEREALGPVRREPIATEEPLLHQPEPVLDADSPHLDEPESWHEQIDQDWHDAELAAPEPAVLEPLPPEEETPGEPESGGGRGGFFRWRSSHAEPEVEPEPEPVAEAAPEAVQEPEPSSRVERWAEIDEEFDIEPTRPAADVSEDPVDRPAPRSEQPPPIAFAPSDPKRSRFADPDEFESEPREDLLGETVEYDVEKALRQGTEDDDVLEETPEFLQDTPDHDRLWFEQKPPKDFDFDG